MEDTILTFTIKDLAFIRTHGCDESWVLNTDRAGTCKYLVCCHSQGAEKGAAFCVGLISRLRAIMTEAGKERYAIHISAYAEIDVPDVWQGWRNPVRYTTLADLDINLEQLTFEPLPAIQTAEIFPLSIQQAKEGLAKKFNISANQIDIIIKG